MELKQLSRGKALSINITSVPILQSVINPQLFRYGALLYFRLNVEVNMAFAISIFMSRPLSRKVNRISYALCRYIPKMFNSRYYSYLRELLGVYTVVGDHVVVWSRAIGI